MWRENYTLRTVGASLYVQYAPEPSARMLSPMGRFAEKYTPRQRAAVTKAKLERELGGDGLSAGRVVKLAAAGELQDADGRLDPFVIGVSYVYSLRNAELRRRNGEVASISSSPQEALEKLTARLTRSLGVAVDRHDARARNRRMSPTERANEVRDLARAGLELERLARAVHPQTPPRKTGHPGRAKDAPSSDVERLIAESKRSPSHETNETDNGEQSSPGPPAEEQTTHEQHNASADLPHSLAEAGFQRS